MLGKFKISSHTCSPLYTTYSAKCRPPAEGRPITEWCPGGAWAIFMALYCRKDLPRATRHKSSCLKGNEYQNYVFCRNFWIVPTLDTYNTIYLCAMDIQYLHQYHTHIDYFSNCVRQNKCQHQTYHQCRRVVHQNPSEQWHWWRGYHGRAFVHWPALYSLRKLLGDDGHIVPTVYDFVPFEPKQEKIKEKLIRNVTCKMGSEEDIQYLLSNKDLKKNISRNSFFYKDFQTNLILKVLYEIRKIDVFVRHQSVEKVVLL